jgi:hypothetical protein
MKDTHPIKEIANKILELRTIGGKEKIISRPAWTWYCNKDTIEIIDEPYIGYSIELEDFGVCVDNFFAKVICKMIHKNASCGSVKYAQTRNKIKETYQEINQLLSSKELLATQKYEYPYNNFSEFKASHEKISFYFNINNIIISIDDFSNIREMRDELVKDCTDRKANTLVKKVCEELGTEMFKKYYPDKNLFGIYDKE